MSTDRIPSRDGEGRCSSCFVPADMTTKSLLGTGTDSVEVWQSDIGWSANRSKVRIGGFIAQ